MINGRQELGMSEDDSVRKEVWDGKIPVCFTVDDRELSASIKKTPEPCYVRRLCACTLCKQFCFLNLISLRMCHLQVLCNTFVALMSIVF